MKKLILKILFLAFLIAMILAGAFLTTDEEVERTKHEVYVEQLKRAIVENEQLFLDWHTTFIAERPHYPALSAQKGYDSLGWYGYFPETLSVSSTLHDKIREVVDVGRSGKFHDVMFCGIVIPEGKRQIKFNSSDYLIDTNNNFVEEFLKQNPGERFDVVEGEYLGYGTTRVSYILNAETGLYGYCNISPNIAWWEREEILEEQKNK